MRARAEVARTDTPVVLTDGRLLGYVFPAPVPPTERRGRHDGDHWTYARADTGYVSPLFLRSRAAAVEKLLAVCGVVDTATVLDLDVMAALHTLARRYTRRDVARYALAYATATPDAAPDADLEHGGGVVGRHTVRQVVSGLIGPATAEELMRACDAVAGPPHLA